VWVDEFEALGLGHVLERQYDDALCYFQEGKAVSNLCSNPTSCMQSSAPHDPALTLLVQQ